MAEEKRSRLRRCLTCGYNHPAEGDRKALQAASGGRFSTETKPKLSDTHFRHHHSVAALGYPALQNILIGRPGAGLMPSAGPDRAKSVKV
jgi:hypothetical protein